MLRTALPVIMQCRLMEREFIKGGRAAGKSPKEFPKKQIKMGIKVEHEHTPKRGIAQEIAMDHLAEFPDYYTRLHKMEAQAKRAHRVAESALPATKRCRLMEMIELKPWKHSAKRAATPEAEALARQVRQGARAQKIDDKIRARRRGSRITGKELNLQPRLWQRAEDAHVGIHRAWQNATNFRRDLGRHVDVMFSNNPFMNKNRELAKASAGVGVRQGIRDADAELAHKKVDRTYNSGARGEVGLDPGDKIEKIHGRPSSASKKPEGPQDLRLNLPKKKPWYQFWGDKEAPKPEPMDVKAPLFRKRYWAESSIVRRGILMENK